MIYTVFQFDSLGNSKTYQVKAKTWKQAALQVGGRVLVVGGNQSRRYINGKPIKPERMKHSKSWINKEKAYLVTYLVGKTKYCELLPKTLVEELLTDGVISTPNIYAQSVKSDERLTSITVSSQGTKGTKLGSMLRKTSNSSATNATCGDLETQENTEKNSGKNRWKGMGRSTWKIGTTPSLSKSNQDILKSISEDIQTAYLRKMKKMLYYEPKINPLLEAIKHDIMEKSGKGNSEKIGGYTSPDYGQNAWLYTGYPTLKVVNRGKAKAKYPYLDYGLAKPSRRSKRRNENVNFNPSPDRTETRQRFSGVTPERLLDNSENNRKNGC